MRTCTVPGCLREHNARGLCNSHYESWWRSANPERAKKEASEKYKASRDTIRRVAKERYTVDPSKQRAGSRAYYAANRGAISERRREQYRATSPERRAERALATKDAKYRRLHGVSLAEVEAMKTAQGDACAICHAMFVLGRDGKDANAAVLDHCHATGRVRGLLCNHCNRGLGLFRDNASALAAAALYVSAAKTDTSEPARPAQPAPPDQGRALACATATPRG